MRNNQKQKEANDFVLRISKYIGTYNILERKGLVYCSFYFNLILIEFQLSA